MSWEVVVIQGAYDKDPDWMVAGELEKVVVSTDRGDGLDLEHEGKQRPAYSSGTSFHVSPMISGTQERLHQLLSHPGLSLPQAPHL